MSFGGGQGKLGLLPVFDQGQDGSFLRSEPCWGIAVFGSSPSIGTCAPVLITGRLLTGMRLCLATVLPRYQRHVRTLTSTAYFATSATVNSAGTACCQSVSALKGL